MPTNEASDPKYKIVTQNTYQTLTTENERAMGMDGAGGGADGKSAYQIAVDNGFDGSEQDWLDSLKGTPGTAAVQVFETYADAPALPVGTIVVSKSGA